MLRQLLTKDRGLLVWRNILGPFQTLRPGHRRRVRSSHRRPVPFLNVWLLSTSVSWDQLPHRVRTLFHGILVGSHKVKE